MLYVSILMFFGKRKAEAIAIGYQSEPFLVNLDVLHYIAVHPIVLDDFAGPCNPLKLVVICEKGACDCNVAFPKAPSSYGPGWSQLRHWCLRQYHKWIAQS